VCFALRMGYTLKNGVYSWNNTLSPLKSTKLLYVQSKDLEYFILIFNFDSSFLYFSWDYIVVYWCTHLPFV